MLLKKYSLIILIFSFSLFSKAQNTFSLTNHLKKETVRFQLINNLILLPLTINGKELTFLVDTGVKQSILFNVSVSDSLDLKHVKKVLIRGLGEDDEFKALESKNNLLRIGNVVCPDFKVLIILDKRFDFSARMGTDVNGIIGSELFKDFIVEVNYSKKKISFNNPKTYRYKKCRKCTSLPLKFHYQKPYINGQINTTNGKSLPVKLLIDSGSGDSLWLFDKSLEGYNIPPKNFDDLLGKGLGGDIFGKRSKLKSFNIHSFKFNDLVVSHPDSSSAIGNNIHFMRNGLIGSELLKRFHLIYDYPNKKITLKKNRKYYKNPFSYNKTGIEIIHYGKVLVKEEKSKILFKKNSYDTKEIISTFSYSFKNAYQISFIKANSVADKIGLQKDDLISSINGVAAYNFTLQQIIQKFSDKAGKNIHLKISRNGLFYHFYFTLEEML